MPLKDMRVSCAEMALAYRIGSSTENAYRRTDLLEERWHLMEDWASWCCDE